MTNTQWLRERLMERVMNGTPIGDKTESLEELRRTEWSSIFESLMKNRLLVGRFRYGRMDDESKGDYDHIGSIRKRLDLYVKSGNKEHLVDIANLCLVEFVHCKHPDAHFDAQDDSEHCKRIG